MFSDVKLFHTKKGAAFPRPFFDEKATSEEHEIVRRIFFSHF